MEKTMRLNPDISKVVVRFGKEFPIPADGDINRHLEKMAYKPWAELKKLFPGVTISPLVSPGNIPGLNLLLSRALKMNPAFVAPDLMAYCIITCPEKIDPKKLHSVVRKWEYVKHTYIEPLASNPSPIPDFSTNTDASSQGYLNSAPDGIGSKVLWNPFVPGSDGSGSRFVDVENGWNQGHNDLTGQPISLIGTNPSPSGISHGTSVLGVICAADNNIRCIGVAPKLNYAGLIAISGWSSLADAIIAASANLYPGDVLLIEAQYVHPDYFGSGINAMLPVEITAGVKDAIMLAVNAGIAVIEPGGNGDENINAVNFDSYVDPDGFLPLCVTDPEYTDSGAIIVTASKSAVSSIVPGGLHEKSAWAPFGKRPDCYAWGENICTLDSDDPPTVYNSITTTFGMTSGAAAIIAGAILSIQAMARAKSGGVFTPGYLRTMLRDASLGTRLHATGTTSLLDIYMPDLYTVYNSVISVLPVLTLTINKTDITCNGSADGTATASVTGSAGPFSYLWNTVPAQTTSAISGLSPGEITVYVTINNQLIISGSVMITEPDALSADLEYSPVTCHGAANGVIEINNAAGGTGTYEYSVDNGSTWDTDHIFNNCAPGTYDVKMKDSNNCVLDLGQVTLTDPQALSASVSHTDSTANGANDGTITISNMQGGYNSYQYSYDGGTTWENSTTKGSLGPGTYNVMMRDLTYVDCEADIGTVVINEPVQAFSLNANVKHVIKFGDSTGEIFLVASGGTPPYTFLWNNGATSSFLMGLPAGTYSVTATDNSGASVNRTIKVNHIYFEIARKPLHSLTLRFLWFLSPSLFTSRIYRIRWKGRFHPPTFLHPHPHVRFENISLVSIGQVSDAGSYWTEAVIKVRYPWEGRIVISPPDSSFPVFFRDIRIPVKVWRSRYRWPFPYGEILVGEFRLVISNHLVDFTL